MPTKQLKIGKCYKITITVALYCDKSFKLAIYVKPGISFIVLDKFWVYEASTWHYKILYNSKIYYMKDNWAFCIDLDLA